MSEPLISQKAPYPVELGVGTHWWCACGRSAKQPFCDGSHKGSGISPVVCEVSERKTVWLCGCKHTQNPPFCDGTHAKL